MTNGYAFLSTKSVLTERFPYDITSLNCYDTHSSPHWHNFTQILYSSSGSYSCIINNEKYFCPAGTVVIMFPYTIHKIDISETDFNETSVMKIDIGENPKGFFALTYEKGVFYDKALPCFMMLSRKEKTKADDIISRISCEYEKKQNMNIKRIEKLISDLLELCAGYINSPVSERTLKSAKAYAEEIKSATDFIKEHCRENLTASDVACVPGLSKSGFMVKFKAVTGLTFNEYFGRVRAYEALSLLRYSTKSVAEIAEEFGYSSSARFVHSCIRLFKKSPLQIKKDWMKYDRQHGADIHKIDMDEQAWKNIWNEEEVYIRTANAEIKY